eukprot:scaffold3382_cov58-Phaeocystis_antarctica.AAC.2
MAGENKRTNARASCPPNSKSSNLRETRQALGSSCAAPSFNSKLGGLRLPMVPAHLVQRLQQENGAAKAEVASLKARLALTEAAPPPAADATRIARRTSDEDASGEAALGGSEELLPSAALCALLELHPGKQHQPMAGRDLLALLLDAGHLQLASARRGARARWQAALKPAIALGAAVTDPWLEHNVHKQPTELAVRWDYDAATDAWTSSETLIKMERTPST